jgi:hypothetical protein
MGYLLEETGRADSDGVDDRRPIELIVARYAQNQPSEGMAETDRR